MRLLRIGTDSESKISDKIDCQKPKAKLGIGKLRSTILPNRRKQRRYQAVARGAEKALKQVNGVLLKPQRGAFGKSVRRKLKKVVFFGDRKHFFRRSVCQRPVDVTEYHVLRSQRNAANDE